MDDLDVITAEPDVVHAGGRGIKVVPLSPRLLSRFLQAVRPLQDAAGNGIDLDGIQFDVIAGLVEHHMESVVQAVAIATREPVDFIGDDINVEELVLLVIAVIRTNADFFARRVMPALTKAIHALQAGPNPSSAS